MEETLENSCFISLHRNQQNPRLHPKSTLTFAYGDRKYGKLIFHLLRNLIACFLYL
jgi:hypothetical protein